MHPNEITLIAALAVVCGIAIAVAIAWDWIVARFLKWQTRRMEKEMESLGVPIEFPDHCEECGDSVGHRLSCSKHYRNPATRGEFAASPNFADTVFVPIAAHNAFSSEREQEILKAILDFKRQGSAAYRPKAYRAKR